MPSGVGMELILVAGLLVLLIAAFVVGMRLRRRPKAAAEAPPAPVAEGLGARIRSLVGRGVPTDEDWRRLEELLVRADVGPRAARELVTRVREAFDPGDDPAELLRREVAGMFQGDPPLRLPQGFAVVVVVGVNGTGKTTTIGKLAHRWSRAGRSVALAASDTFRAAAAEQLGRWAERAGVELVAQKRGADPGAVAYDAVGAARARGRDVLIVDTAGRIHTRKPLMEELAKVSRVIERAAGRPPDEILLVVDATTGQNGMAQARTFLEATKVSGIALTKLDGTARGGIVLAIREELGLPVKLVGTGEGIEDLEEFDPEAFAADLLSSDSS